MIEIITKPRKLYIEGAGERWQCDLHLTRGGKTWYLPATAPDNLLEEELRAYFDNDEDHLWDIACAKQYPPDIFENAGAKRVVKALALAALDEINRSREADGEPTLTKQEWRQMILNKLKGT